MVYIDLDAESAMPLKRQIYSHLREMILSGGLKPGEKLPPSRQLSESLSVSRNTVLEALDSLIAEGYLKSAAGSGLFVHEGIRPVQYMEKIADYSVSAYSEEEIPEGCIAYRSGTPDLSLFPRAKWSKAANRAFLDAPVSAFGYDFPQGRPDLRNVLSRYLEKTRNIRCSAEDIIITAGTKQALTIVAKALLRPESEAFIEDPSNINVRKIFSYHTDKIIPLPVDGEGLVTSKLPVGKNPALIFTTPSHQFPLGGFMPVSRRLELLEYASRTGCYIVEDDYDSEFCYRGYPVSAMQGLNPERVIYVGTFSKILYPSLRIGYLVLPRALTESFREVKRLMDHHTNSLNQLALMRFIEGGELERHVAKMKKIYKRRRDAALSAVRDIFGGSVKITGEGSGMHIVAEFKDMEFTPDVMEAVREKSVYATCIEEHAIVKGIHANKLILGYASLEEKEIREGLNRLKQAVYGS